MQKKLFNSFLNWDENYGRVSWDLIRWLVAAVRVGRCEFLTTECMTARCPNEVVHRNTYNRSHSIIHIVHLNSKNPNGTQFAFSLNLLQCYASSKLSESRLRNLTNIATHLHLSKTMLALMHGIVAGRPFMCYQKLEPLSQWPHFVTHTSLAAHAILVNTQTLNHRVQQWDRRREAQWERETLKWTKNEWVECIKDLPCVLEVFVLSIMWPCTGSLLKWVWVAKNSSQSLECMP